MEEVVRSAPVIQETGQAPESTKVIKLDGGLALIVESTKPFEWNPKICFALQIDLASITLLAQKCGSQTFDTSNRILILANPCQPLNIQSDQHVLVPSSP